MSKRKMKIGLAAAAAVTCVAAQVLAWTYDVGPNWVNLSATSCHGFSGPQEAKLVRSVGEVKVTGGSSQVLYCPINRRGTMFYGTYKATNGAGNPNATGNRPYYVNIQNITVRANDTSSNDFVYCWAFGTNKDTGSTSFGASKTLCATAGGCSAASTSYTGTNSLSMTFPFPTLPTVNYGYACSVADQSRLYYSETSITPNP